MDFYAIILSCLSGLLLIFTIVFEGTFKKNEEAQTSLRKELKQITKMGFGLIGLAFLVSTLTVITTIDSEIEHQKELSDTKGQYRKDSTTASLRHLGQMENLKRIKAADSASTYELLLSLKGNGNKTDSARRELQDRTLGQILENQKRQNQITQNAYIQLRVAIYKNVTNIKSILEMSDKFEDIIETKPEFGYKLFFHVEPFQNYIPHTGSEFLATILELSIDGMELVNDQLNGLYASNEKEVRRKMYNAISGNLITLDEKLNELLSLALKYDHFSNMEKNADKFFDEKYKAKLP